MVDISLKIKKLYGTYPKQVILWIGEGKPPFKKLCRLGNITLRCDVVDIKEIDGEQLLESQDVNDYLIAALCRRNPDFFKKFIDKIVALPTRERGDFLRKFFIIARLRRDLYNELERLSKEVEKMPIVFDIEKDPVYHKGIEKGISQGIKMGMEMGIERGMEKGLKKGREEGLALGLEKGILQGNIMATRELLVEALEIRFGEISKELKDKINSIEDKDLLKKLHKLTIMGHSLTEVLRELDDQSSTTTEFK